MQIRARVTSPVADAGLLPLLPFLLLTALLAGCAGSAGKLPPAFEVIEPALVEDTTPRHYYVDGSLNTNPCPAYDPLTRRCGAGRELAFNNLADANGMARAGDVIDLRGDRYNQPIRPETSGTSISPLTYRAFPGEVPIIVVATEPALQLRRVQHVVIRGIHFENSLGWGRLEEAHHNHIIGNTFTEALARGTTGGLKLVRSHHNRIENNRFHRGNDAIVIQDSGHNLVTGNHLEFARHTLISIRCGNYNVVRGNYLHNARQKTAEIYDCEGVSDAPVKYDVTKRNLWEFNHFAHVTGSSEPDNFNGIQYAAQAGIVRHNWFIDNQGGALHLAIYAEEALYVYGNRIYGNRFLHNRCGALSAGNLTPLRAGDNRVQGNIFAGNLDCGGNADRVPRHPVYSLAGNLETGKEGAALPEIWPAMTTAAGSGASMPLDDVLPFYDGYNISGESGDEIELRSSRQRARVTGIDYTTRTLRLDRTLQWDSGEGVRVVTPDLPRPGRHPGFPPQ